MISIVKSKIKHLVHLITGRFDHIKTSVTITKKWYGNNYGGFYVCPDRLNKDSVVYSIGIGEDISFDETLIAKHHCSVFGFDPTPKSIKWVESQANKISPAFKFCDFGLGSTTGPVTFYLPKNSEHVSGSLVQQTNVDEKRAITVQMKSLTDIAHEFGHKKVDLLKMDIEGAEYHVVNSILSSTIQVDQLLIEFHERFFDDGKEKTKTILSQLKDKGYVIFGVSESFEEISLIRKALLV